MYWVLTLYFNRNVHPDYGTLQYCFVGHALYGFLNKVLKNVVVYFLEVSECRLVEKHLLYVFLIPLNVSTIPILLLYLSNKACLCYALTVIGWWNGSNLLSFYYLYSYHQRMCNPLWWTHQFNKTFLQLFLKRPSPPFSLFRTTNIFRDAKTWELFLLQIGRYFNKSSRVFAALGSSRFQRYFSSRMA